MPLYTLGLMGKEKQNYFMFFMWCAQALTYICKQGKYKQLLVVNNSLKQKRNQ